MNETKVVNVKSGEPYDLYIGRANPRYGLKQSIWHNPDKEARRKPADQALAEYRAYVLGRPDLVARLGELRGKVLACWGKPNFCHGDVLKDLADGESK